MRSFVTLIIGALLGVITVVLVLGFATDVFDTNTGGAQPTHTPTLTPTATTTTTVSCDIQWDEAKYYIGEYKTVCGPVVDTHYASTSSGQPTFLNLGKAYPNLDRFTVVIWGDDRDNFPWSPEDYYYSKNIAVTGLIQEYEGSSQIFVSSPSQIQEY